MTSPFTVADDGVTSHVTSMQQQQLLVTDVASIVADNISSSGGSSSNRGPKDPQGAGYYVIAVVLVYGMSIVLLIASVIRRKRSKVNVDREIVRYLQEFQTVRERSSRDSYRRLKRAIIAKLSRSGKEGPGTHRGLADIVLAASAIAAPNVRRSTIAFDPAYRGPLLKTSASTNNCVQYATDQLQPSPPILVQLDTGDPPVHFHQQQQQQQRTRTIHVDSPEGSRRYVMDDEAFLGGVSCNGDYASHGLLNAESAVGQQRRHLSNGDTDRAAFTGVGATLRVQLHQGVDGWKRVVTFE